MYNFKLKIRDFPKKKLFSIFRDFFKSRECELTVMIAFLLLNTKIKAIFSYHVQLSRNFMPKVQKYKVYFDSDYFMFDQVFQYFSGS